MARLISGILYVLTYKGLMEQVGGSCINGQKTETAVFQRGSPIHPLTMISIQFLPLSNRLLSQGQ
jgi:hypothetical protein